MFGEKIRSYLKNEQKEERSGNCGLQKIKKGTMTKLSDLPQRFGQNPYYLIHPDELKDAVREPFCVKRSCGIAIFLRVFSGIDSVLNFCPTLTVLSGSK
jgi:hypothetical protein